MKNPKAKIKIDTPKFSFIKYKDNGKIDYISPIPFTVNYGSILNTISAEGDRIDAVVLGRSLRKNIIKEFPIVGVIKFYDAGKEDFKYICSDFEMTKLDKLNIILFFTCFSIFKFVLNRIRGKKGKTKFIGIEK